MRSYDIFLGIVAILAAIGLVVLAFYDVYYAGAMVVLFWISLQIYHLIRRRRQAKTKAAADHWRSKI